MALDIKLDIKTSKDCNNLIITENSGNFNENNSGGWGDPNFDSLNKILVFSIQCYFKVTVSPSGETKVINPIASFSSDMDFYANFVVEDDVKGLKLVIPYSALYIGFHDNINEVPISLGLTVEEKDYLINNFPEWETIEDHVYLVGVNLYEAGGENTIVGSSLNTSTIVQFNSVCNIEHKVEDHLTKLDFRCEDCNDQDIRDVAFYNVLLQNLKNA